MLSKDSPARRSSQDKDIGEIDLIHFINSSDTSNFKTIKNSCYGAKFSLSFMGNYKNPLK